MYQMEQGQRKYEKENRVQAVKLAKEIGAGKAAQELGVPVDRLYGWQKAVGEGRLDAGPGSHGPEAAMSLLRKWRRCASRSRNWKSQLTAEGRERVFGGGQHFFRREPSEISKEQRMRFVAKKTDGGE